jgi:hypothetical protein
MARSRLNLVIDPAGLQAAGRMERSLGIPHVFLPVSYRLETIAENYHLLMGELRVEGGCDFDFSRFESEARDSIAKAAEAVGDLPVIVDDSAVLKSFELARALIEYGFRVAMVVTGECPEIDRGNLLWMLENAPQVEIVQPEHHNSVRFDRRIERSLSVGVDGAYLSGSNYLLDLLGDAGMYGYRGVTSLMERMVLAVERKADLRAVIDSYGLVV